MGKLELASDQQSDAADSHRDPIFIFDGQAAGEERTVGEWTAAQKNAQSHRARAFRELAPVLEAL